MVAVTIGTNLERKEVLVDASTKIKDLFEDNGVAYQRATNYLDGAPITVEDMHKSLEELGITDTCALISIIKLDNA